MDILTTLRKQAEQVEVLSMRNTTTIIQYEANQLKSCNMADTKGMAVRVICKGRLGFSASTDGTATDRLAAKAIESSAYGGLAPFSFAEPKPVNDVRAYDKVLAELPITRLVEIGKEIVDLVLRANPHANCKIWLERKLASANIRNQKGLEISYQTSPLLLRLQIDRIEGDDMLMLVDILGTTVWNKDYLAFASRMADQLKLARTVTTIKPGKMPVLFSPVGSQALTFPLSEALNGREVYQGASPIKDKVGEKLFDEKITLVDDGTIDGGFASAACDDEGVPHRRNALVENGVLKGFIYDLKTAGQARVESTGNASRGYFAPFNPPDSAFTNIILQPGQTPLKDIIAGINEGILVESLLGLGIGNTISGAFSNPLALAFKIEKGEITGRVKDLSIAGNVYDLLKEVAVVSQEAQWVDSTFYAPYILIPEMNVAGKN